MASYVDNSFRQAVMMNPADRTQQVRAIYYTFATDKTCFHKCLFPPCVATFMTVHHPDPQQFFFSFK